MTQKRIDELEYWLRSAEPRAKSWRRGQSADHLRKMGVELDELRTAETARQKQESLQATLKKFDEAIATGYAAMKRQEQEAARQATQAAVEHRRRAEAEQLQAIQKRRAEAAYRQAGGDPADFEATWANGLRDQVILEETARERQKQESLAYVPRL